MQYGTIGNEYKYDLTEEKFKIAFAFLHRTDLAQLPEGWVDLEKGVRASVQHYVTFPEDELFFESHEKYFDIQYLVEGTECVGVCTRDGLIVRSPYEAGNDITFYEEPSLSGSVLLRAGDYVVLSPEDAHKPRCAAGSTMAVKKIVVKVPV